MSRHVGPIWKPGAKKPGGEFVQSGLCTLKHTCGQIPLDVQ